MGDYVLPAHAADYPVIQGHNRYRLRRGPVGGGESESIRHEPEEASLIAGQGDDHRVGGLGVQDQGVGSRLSTFYQGKGDEGARWGNSYASGVIVDYGEGGGPDGQGARRVAGDQLRAQQGNRLVLLVDVVIHRLEPQRGGTAGLTGGDRYVEGLDFLESALVVLHLYGFEVVKAGSVGGAGVGVKLDPAPWCPRPAGLPGAGGRWKRLLASVSGGMTR